MKPITRKNLLIALTYSVTLIGGMFLGYKFLKDQGFNFQRDLQYADNNADKVDQIINLINKNYVDEIDADTLSHSEIDSLLHQLDPHSVYLPPVKLSEQSDMLEGNFEGIGIEYYILKDTLLITNVIKDGPAYLAGLKLGDKILKIDTMFVSGKHLAREKMIGRIKGKKGTAVQLLIQHPGVLHPQLMSVKRGRVSVSSIDASYMINSDAGYVRISEFGANTDKDFTEAVKALKASGMKKLILDLRDNGGGYLMAATGLANQLLPENKLIVYTEGKHEPRTDYIATGGGEFEDGKLAVLINENSASASEILAGAIQDLDRGIIVGRRSFGKGLVQEQFPFGDGSALNLTIARYYTPLGRSIQKSYKRGYTAYQNELEDRYNDGEITEKPVAGKDSINKNAVYTTGQGKKVFAGGGIQPDIYVRLDTAGMNKFYGLLLDKKVMFDYVFDVLANRYTAAYLEQNLLTFSLSETDYKDFVRYIPTKGILIDPKQLNGAKQVLFNDLKALLYKYHLGESGYYRVVNLTDNVVKQALASLQ